MNNVVKNFKTTREMKDSKIEWIGEIPKEWETVFINQIFTQTKNKNIDLQEKNLLSLSYGKIIRKNIETREGLLPENFNTYNIINSGDIVLRLTDLQNDQRSLRCGIAKEKGIITSAYITLRNVKPIINDYYYYLIHSYDIMKVFYGMGSGVRQGLTFEGLKRMRLLVPSLHEQQAIANYLDEKVGKIDNLIAEQKIALEKWKEYKESLITETVTKGLHSDDSKTWKMYKLGDLGKYKKGPFGSSLKISMFVEKGDKTFKVYEQKNAIKKDATIGEAYITLEDFENLKSFEVKEKDIIVSCAGTIGECYVLPEKIEKGIINQALMKVTVDDSLEKDYFVKLLQVSLKELSKEFSNGSAIKNIPPFSVLKKHKVLVPSINRQKEILLFLDEKCSKIDQTIEQKQTLIKQLEEYKQSLIYECVTGKRCVL